METAYIIKVTKLSDDDFDFGDIVNVLERSDIGITDIELLEIYEN